MSRQFVYKKVYVAYTFIYSTYNYASQTHGIMQCVYGTNEYNKNIAVIYLEHKKTKKINNISQQKWKKSGQENKQNPTLVSQLLQ